MVKYRAGSILVYRTGDRTLRKVLVRERCRDIKNGQPGFSGVILDDRGRALKDAEGQLDLVWGYDRQILDVLDV